MPEPAPSAPNSAAAPAPEGADSPDAVAPSRPSRVRTRLTVAAIGLVAGVAIGLILASGGGDDDDVDARLSDPQAVVTFPTDGLGNSDVRGDALPLASISDRSGRVFSTAELVGQPLVVNFWFAACAPCAKELPDFAKVHAEVGDEVRFVGINTLDSVQEMERFAGDRGVAYELYRDDVAEFTDAIGATAFPITLFVASNGMIVEQTGVLDADELRAKVASLMEVESQLG